ncbi:hypothetical protein LguiB_004114 [Lonicera macranthoides]
MRIKVKYLEIHVYMYMYIRGSSMKKWLLPNQKPSCISLQCKISLCGSKNCFGDIRLQEFRDLFDNLRDGFSFISKNIVDNFCAGDFNFSF